MAIGQADVDRARQRLILAVKRARLLRNFATVTQDCAALHSSVCDCDGVKVHPWRVSLHRLNFHPDRIQKKGGM